MKTTEKINLNPMKNGSQTHLIIGKNTGIEILITPNEIERSRKKETSQKEKKWPKRPTRLPCKILQRWTR